MKNRICWEITWYQPGIRGSIVDQFDDEGAAAIKELIKKNGWRLYSIKSI